MNASGLNVGVVGGTGYSGGELCRLLLAHPAVDKILPTSRGDQPFERNHRNLLGCGLEFVTPEQLLADVGDLDVVFFCTPTGEAMSVVERYLDHGVRVIDLSADFRFGDPDTYRAAHGLEHTAPHLLTEAVYGISELNRERVRSARLVANPGCYVITAVLGLAPLLTSGMASLDAPLHVSAINGTTGASSTPKRDVMHPHVFGSILPYNMEGHRHAPELEDVLGALTERRLTVDLNTAHGDFARGIYVQASVPLLSSARHKVDQSVLSDLYEQAYGAGHDGEHFVLLNDFPKSGKLNAKDYDVYPSVAAVRGSNFCHLGVDYDESRGIAKVIAVTDNLVKGAAGSAIQNMNTMFELPEIEGLRHYGA
ncbi:N-acetyl-gamma-glutamyl-phosphate reductase [Actinopolyspora mzabensis]|uniref:N-acetyl-gamma-glutamyl-phosphate reductase n=1 Tax=Actinopolyspora mzabensis TaxID=995066 RepID=A0A1G9A1E6_ACTMZ|nr:N-acetyl-gamma-glutamyl-phosphate reductase [Actinopolyspora mzabensis]SDK21081.1 N-acetyl-gamma-glutamyl-phosphate reductase [Actinopolyspora mzabensis]